MISYAASRIDIVYDVVYDILMLKIVLDTDVMFAAFHSPVGAARHLLLEVLDGKAHLLLSTTLMIEYEAVLTRPANVAKFVGVLDEIAGLCVPVAFDYRWRPGAADPDDDLVLETAINGAADVIASFNLVDMAAAAGRFGIPVERPKDVLRRLRS